MKNADEYMLEDYVYSGRDAVHYLETMYVGALDKDEWDDPLPFVLFYDKDELRLNDDGVYWETCKQPERQLTGFLHVVRVSVFYSSFYDTDLFGRCNKRMMIVILVTPEMFLIFAA